MSKNVLLIINPCAGKMKSKSHLFNIVSYLCAADITPTVHITQSRGDATDYVRKHSADFDYVICCGGDGTLNETISGVIDVDKTIPIGYIPAGTTNDLASSLGLPKSIDKATKSIISGSPSYHDIGLLSNGKLFTYIASFGAFTQTSYTTPQELKNTLGHAAYMLGGISSLSEIKSTFAKITIDGETIEGDYMFGAITNATSIGGLLKLDAKSVNFNDGIFEVILIKKPDYIIEYTKIFSDLLLQRYDEKYVNMYHAKHIHVETSDDLGWTVDGEYAGDFKDITIDNIHEKISFIR